MYRIVSYDEFDACPDTFHYFETALMIKELDYPGYIIEYWDLDKETREIVWEPGWFKEGESLWKEI